MNRQFASRMKRLEDKGPSGPSAIIVYARWDELNEDAINAAFVGPPPSDIPIYVFTECMTVEEWLASVRKHQEDPTWHKTHGGKPIVMFPGLHTAKRIRIADRPVKCWG